MAQRVDPGDPAILAGINEVRDDNSPTDWILIGYVPKSNNRLQVVGKGTGGWEEMCEELNEGKVQFGFCRFRVNEVYRFVYLSWMGEGVQGLMKGNFNNHSHDMQYVFKGFHVQVNARDEEDLDINNVKKRLVTGVGANYDAGQVQQGTRGGGGGAAPKQVSKGPIIDKEASEKFWQQQSAAEKSAAANQQQQQKPQIKADASGLKSKFERLAEEQKPDVPPPRSAPPPKKIINTPAPAPVHTPAPAPVQQQEYTYEQTYEESYPEEAYEESYEESYAEESYPEEESYSDNSAQSYATALYDFPGENEGDLAFYAGDQILILDTSDPSGWWQGELNGATGYFPSNFVQY